MAGCSSRVPNHVQKHVVGLDSVEAFREESIGQWVQDKADNLLTGGKDQAHVKFCVER